MLRCRPLDSRAPIRPLPPIRPPPPARHLSLHPSPLPGHLLLDIALVGPELAAALALAAAQGATSLRLLDVAALARDFLPALMPLAWRDAGAGRVAGDGVGGDGDSEGCGGAPDVTR